ncbi:serine protease Hayan-like [Zeugodacus cucurbitae]|uniref:serine protease Hayan-like n=1 Tax=Zeugodacus cucurbitae TaxID=28588 RepID=UPI0023D90F1D|nr:serine protease Hayan-like [Zeugodacus cucurbitae]
MKNNLILFGLYFALLQATVYGKRNEPDPSIIGEPLKINVDAGKEREKQSLTDDALERMTAKIEALEERITAEAKATEDRCTQRMTAEANATEERWNQRLTEVIKTAEGRMSAEITRLNQKVVELSNQLAKRTDVATPQKRPAELACEKITNELRSIDPVTSFSAFLFKSDSAVGLCRGNWIDKRFYITAAGCVSTVKFTKIEVGSEHKEIKAVHIHPDFSSETPSLNNIALIEMVSDLDYSSDWHPVCLYTSQVNPESYLMGYFGKIQIVADGECFDKTGADLKPSQLCAKNLKFKRTFLGMPIYKVQENFPIHKLFAIVAKESDDFEPYVITKVFDHLDFIESIVWPKNGN